MKKNLPKIIIGVVVVVIILLFIGGWVLGIGGKTNSEGGSSPLGTFFSLFTGGQTPGESPTASTPMATIQSESGETIVIPRLRQVYDKPTAGAIFLVRNISTTTLEKQVIKPVTIPATFIRFTDRATGHIYETKPDSLITSKISNTTIPKIYEAIFTNGGGSVIYRYLNNDLSSIETYYGNLIEPTFSTSTPPAGGSTTTSSLPPTPLLTSSTKYQLVGKMLTENIDSLAVSPSKDRIFYTQIDANGSKGFIAPTNNNQARQILTYPLREWLINWESANTIVLTTKPASGVNGFVFFLNSSTGGLSKVFGNVPGLTVLPSPDLSYILFSSSSGANFNLSLYDVKKGTSLGISLQTLPEKCVWSHLNASVVYCGIPLIIPPGSYPDIWYQGGVLFNDTFWKINVKTGERTLIAKPNDLAKVGIDATNLSLDANENYLMFINKKDLTLWDLLINQPAPAAPVAPTSTPTTTPAYDSVRSTILR